MQVLPFCSEETLTILEANLGSMPTITKLLNDGLNATVRPGQNQGHLYVLHTNSNTTAMQMIYNQTRPFYTRRGESTICDPHWLMVSMTLVRTLDSGSSAQSCLIKICVLFAQGSLAHHYCPFQNLRIIMQVSFTDQVCFMCAGDHRDDFVQHRSFPWSSGNGTKVSLHHHALS